MKKIFDWTVGSFFRSIGRIIAYIVIGGLIAFFLSNSDFRITDLFFTKVKADSFHYAYDTWLYKEKTYNTRLPSIESIGSDNYYGYTWSNLYGINQELGFYHYKYDVSSYDKIRYYYYFNNGSQINNSPSSEVSIYARADTENSGGTAQYNACTTHAVSGSSQYGYIECPLVDGATKLVGVTIFVQMESSETTNYRFGINPNITFIEENNQSNSDTILNNINSNIQAQTQQQQQQHNETISIITDTNTTNEQNETTTFFEDFQFSSDSSGFVGVITAPIRVFEAISLGQFSDLCFTLKSKNVCLPNGNMIWQKSNRTSINGITLTWFGSGSISTGITAFVTLFNLVVGGFLLYKMAVSIKRMVEDLINPLNTRIEVMRL